MFACCAACGADDGVISETQVATLKVQEADTVAVTMPRAAADDEAGVTEPQPVPAEPPREEQKPETVDEEPEPIQEEPIKEEVSTVAPGPVDDGRLWEGTAAWCPGKCDISGQDIAIGEPVDVDRSGGGEVWRCSAAAPGGQASEAAMKASEDFKKSLATGGVPITFAVGEASKTIFATKRPLKLKFDQSTPVVVESVDGHAKELGIEPGWQILGVDGWGSGNDGSVFYCRFVNTLNRLPGDNVLPLLFQMQDGKRKTVAVPSRPCGMVFVKELPAVVSEVKGLATQLSIQVGWKLLRFGSIDVSSFHAFPAFFDAFVAEMNKVPEKK